jgi:peptidoglycan/xylan/chitin deacetylase (PgdA/CDA1 family)
LGWIAEQYPEIVREVAKRGHEIASRGYQRRNIRQMTPAEFREDLPRSRGTGAAGARGPGALRGNLLDRSVGSLGPRCPAEEVRLRFQRGPHRTLLPFGALASLSPRAPVR